MKVDRERVQKHLYDVLSNARDIESLLKERGNAEILRDKHLLRSLKYSLVEISEAMALILQHIIAKHFGTPVKGYIDTVKKAAEKGVLTPELSSNLKPFFDFRNSLVHRYWAIDDVKLLDNCRNGYKDFFDFIEAIERFLQNCAQATIQADPEP